MGYFRCPRTTGERRRAAGDAADSRSGEETVMARGRRGLRTLPNTYDDIFAKPFRWRSWKKHRKLKFRRIADMSSPD